MKYLIILFCTIFVQSLCNFSWAEELTGKLIIGTSIKYLSTNKTIRLIDKKKKVAIGYTQLSPDGSLFAYEQIEQDISMLFIVKLETKEEYPILCGNNLEFGWSKVDNTLLVCDDKRLMVVSADGTIKQGVDIKMKCSSPYCSNNGQYYYFKGGTDEYPNGQIYKYEITSGRLWHIGLIDHLQEIEISPDEKLIAYTKPDQNIYLMTIEGKQLGMLNDSKVMEHRLFWSPDSQYIGYWASKRYEMTDNSLYAINIKTKQIINLKTQGWFSNQWFK
jgi:Tol biopolymer transport system component